MSARLTLIVAYSTNRAIGRDNALPWKLPGDLAHFKRSTLGSPIIMGRKTWDSLGRPLPGRSNIVISRNPAFSAEGAILVPSLEAAIGACGDVADAYVIGGAQIYAQALPLAQRVLATEVHAEVEGDAFFPLLPAFQWKETARAPQPAENGYDYDFVTYERA
ncbi:dihydrofolate reductase [Achromobacter denitrificans]|jgi:dihydrofolate reductase|uniref:Dihydrofolate reductase n=1 Tax=Achromobacter denitrificans TaxID=32002 RepID=A0A3R9HA68_ACHDE|nr:MULTISPECIES: dihydrofolate reductase [Achromobacter]ASC65575.1 dihydrofolate reductase [Achromobacter denitrificans]MBV2159695.1 dihydrofolate reductase [Achromobacter denitrificans]MDF3848884.1 dihydrofolate reductase [Achromobacter denitrificans]MDF3858719.1 dihydrofolate reductase [Achromobacter denitrificans]MDF3939502.1 dihydrofolate reductase [Achromobacter denitrificans]